MSKVIPKGWEYAKLGEVAIINMGQSPSSSNINTVGDGIPFLQGNAEFNSRCPTCAKWCTSPLKLANKGDLLISVRAPVGAMNMADQKYCIGRGLAAIHFSKAFTAFGWYTLLRNIRQLSKLSQGSTFEAINKSSLEQLEFPLPPLPEQRKIATILFSVDNAIEKTKAVIEQTKVMKKGLMQDLLTRGIPGRHKKFKKTPIGEMPEEWEVVRLKEVSQIGNGSTPSKKEIQYWKDGRVPWLTTGKVNDRIIKKVASYITDKALAECSVTLLPRGTILVAMIGQGKTRGMVAYLDIDACINQNFAYIRPNGKLNSWFLFHLLDHQYEILRNSGRGSNQDALNCAILKSYKIPLPPLIEQQKIAVMQQLIENQLYIEEEKMLSLAFLRSALMQVLLAGEVRVKV